MIEDETIKILKVISKKIPQRKMIFFILL